jgi:Ricin-type beta-trefoil lectin domain
VIHMTLRRLATLLLASATALASLMLSVATPASAESYSYTKSNATQWYHFDAKVPANACSNGIAPPLGNGGSPCHEASYTLTSQFPNWTGRWHSDGQSALCIKVVSSMAFVTGGDATANSPDTVSLFLSSCDPFFTESISLWVEGSTASGLTTEVPISTSTNVPYNTKVSASLQGTPSNPQYTGKTYVVGGSNCVYINQDPTSTGGGIPTSPSSVSYALTNQCAGPNLPITVRATMSAEPLLQLQNKNSGLCLAIDQNYPTQGAPGEQVVCGDNSLQDRQWLTASPGGDIALFHLRKNGTCLDLPNESTSDGKQVVAGTCTDHLSQRWTGSLNSDGTYTFIDSNSNRCLDVANERKDQYAPVVQGNCTGHLSQEWSLVPTQ